MFMDLIKKDYVIISILLLILLVSVLQFISINKIFERMPSSYQIDSGFSDVEKRLNEIR